MESLVLFAIVIVIAVVALHLLRTRVQPPSALPQLPFKKKDFLLTRAERTFYDTLLKAVLDDAVVFPKVRLADLVWLPKESPNRQAALNRVLSKHADFVICSRNTLTPRLVIELDDSSHSTDRRRHRDTVFESVLESAGLPFVRVAVKPSYDVDEVQRLLLKNLPSVGRSAKPPEVPTNRR